MKSGTGILNTRNTRATKNPSKGGGRSFFQLNPFFVLFFSALCQEWGWKKFGNLKRF